MHVPSGRPNSWTEWDDFFWGASNGTLMGSLWDDIGKKIQMFIFPKKNQNFFSHGQRRALQLVYWIKITGLTTKHKT